MITLRQIQFALAVARHRHFKRAAEECNISQSALSLGIAEMEKNLGVTIFERNNKQVIITPIGEELLSRAQQIYLDAQQLVERAQADQGELGFGMRIGFITTIAPFLLPVALPVLHDKYPDFKINIHEDVSARLIDGVAAGRLDAAVIALPFDTQGLDVHEFGEERFLVVMHKNDTMTRENRITPTRLKKSNLMLLGEGHCLSEQIADVCNFHRYLNEDHFKEASLNTLIHMAANNMGITLVPEMARPFLSYFNELHAVPLETPGPHRRLAVVTRPHYPRLQQLQRLVDLFREALSKMQGEYSTLAKNR